MTTPFRCLWFLSVPLACFWLATATAAEDRPAPGPGAIVQQHPKFYVRADVDRKDRQYREGDKLRISVSCEEEAYIYALYQQADGKVYQIFPNSGQPDNKLKPNTRVTFPDKDDRFVWKIEGPFGKEVIEVIASKEPLKNLDDPAFRRTFFNPVTPGQMKDIAARLDAAEAKPWTDDKVEITTHDKTWQPPPPPAKRVGVFFGVSHYEFNDLCKPATKNQQGMDLPVSNNDALVLEQLFRQYGKLDDAQVFVNEQATRAQMQKSITEWLPTVSDIGDTVVIFFSGHGNPLPPYKPGDPHVRGCYLMPHDFMPVPALQEFLKKKDEGTLSPELAARLRTILAGAPNQVTIDQAEEILAVKTGVTSDDFGHWLQKLAGRQVIVILNACHSGGFAEEGKSLQSASTAFDFLSPQLTRLKDLGQGDTVLLAACGSKESTLALHASDAELEEYRKATKGIVEDSVKVPLGVFPYYIAESMINDPNPTRIESTYEHCRTAMAAYIDRFNEIRREKKETPITPYQPRLFNHSEKPVLVKP